MKGKITNLFIAIVNILLGILILIDAYHIPQDITELTLQELSVSEIITKATYMLLSLICLIDIYQYYTNKDNREMKTGYLIGIFTLSFFLMKLPAISILPIVSGVMVILSIFKDNAIDVDSTVALSFFSILGIVLIVAIGVGYSYKSLGQYIKNKENEDTLKYSSTFFKYITELDIDEPYINVKVDGKYGYITPSGDKVIDFKYDYASPFVEIVAYDKKFQVALVSFDDMSYVIMKNERKLMSFKSEVSDLDYESKINELKDIYTNTLLQKDEMKFEIEENKNNILKLAKYDENATDYSYRYDYNDTYDLLITKSNLGLGDKFQLAKKDNLDIRIDLECANLDYDENYVYLFSNGLIPYYNVEGNEQGWLTSYGKKKEMTGKAQILDLIDDKIIIRDYNDNTIYFMNNNYEKISENYRDICIINDGYVVKNQNDKYMIINNEFQKKTENEFDIIDISLSKYGLFAVANSDQAIEFNDYDFAIMNYDIIDSNGNVILENVEQIYLKYYQISNDKSEDYVSRYNDVLKQIKNIDFEFVGDKFYTSYLKK